MLPADHIWLDDRRSARHKRAMFHALVLAGAIFSATPGNDGGAAHMSVAQMAPRPTKRVHSITVPIPPPGRGLELPRVDGPRDASRPLIVIDAGHGGHDPGAVNAKLGKQEKDLTLAIAQAIRDELVKFGRLRVAMTRDDDRFLVLQERYDIARRLNADLFISVHADSAENEEAHGATVYTLSEVASDREAARLAARENKADILHGVNLGGQTDDISSILIDLTQRETMNDSAKFAQVLKREAAPYMGFRTPFHRFASLMVLKAPDTPSVLFETGYLSNSDDAAFLSSREGRARIARGVARAVEVHFARNVPLGPR
ncbi:N-acetylmuramoyl-L-alanine amidase family protein [Sphingobium vermicomposti]